MERRGGVVRRDGGPDAYLAGEPDWLLAAALDVPLVIIGLVLIGYLIRQGLITAGVGATRLEISDHPLYPGRQYDVFISQAGRFKLSSLKVSLVCQERATYRQGTDSRTDACTVFKQDLFSVENVELEDPKPFDGRCQLADSGRGDAFVQIRSQRNRLETGRAGLGRRAARLRTRLSRAGPSSRCPEPAGMSEPAIELALAGEKREYEPGDTLSGHYRLLGVAARDVRRRRAFGAVVYRRDGRRRFGGAFFRSLRAGHAGGRNQPAAISSARNCRPAH